MKNKQYKHNIESMFTSGNFFNKFQFIISVFFEILHKFLHKFDATFTNSVRFCYVEFVTQYSLLRCLTGALFPPISGHFNMSLTFFLSQICCSIFDSKDREEVSYIVLVLAK